MTERFAVDASVLAKVYLKDEDYSDLAKQLVTSFVAGSIDLIAPHYILYEVPSTILNAVRRRRLDAEQGRAAVDEFFQLHVPTIGGTGTPQLIIRRAYDLAQSLGCKLYDALYLAVALGFDCGLITADARLHRGLSRKVSQLLWIGDYQPQPGAPP